MNKAYLLLGGNLGNKKENLDTAKNHITTSVGEIIKTSSSYETEPWGFEHEASFLNQVVLVETEKSPQDLLKELLRIEVAMGRTRNSEKYSERTIDIDILFFNSERVEEQNLKIPHPRIQERKFVLVPLHEIAREYVHPVFQKKVSKLLDECTDQLLVKRL